MKANGSSTPRGAIRKWAEENPDLIPSMLDELRTATHEWQPACQKCGYRTKVMLPDWQARAKLLQLITEAVDGRAAVSSALPPPPGRDMSEWTDEQLRAVLDGEKPVAPAGNGSETTPGPHQHGI